MTFGIGWISIFSIGWMFIYIIGWMFIYIVGWIIIFIIGLTLISRVDGIVIFTAFRFIIRVVEFVFGR